MSTVVGHLSNAGDHSILPLLSAATRCRHTHAAMSVFVYMQAQGFSCISHLCFQVKGDLLYTLLCSVVLTQKLLVVCNLNHCLQNVHSLLLLLLLPPKSCPGVKYGDGIVMQATVVCRLTKCMVLSRMESGKPQIGLSPRLSSPDNSLSSMSVPPRCMLRCECMLCCAVNACSAAL